MSIVFGTNNFLSARPRARPLNQLNLDQLNLVMNGVAVEQVEKTKLLGVALDCKLSLSEHIVAGSRA